MSKDGAGGGGMAMFSFPPGDAERRNAGKPNTPAPTDVAAAVWRKLRREMRDGDFMEGDGQSARMLSRTRIFSIESKNPGRFSDIRGFVKVAVARVTRPSEASRRACWRERPSPFRRAP
jgi:hypothetical protein